MSEPTAPQTAAAPDARGRTPFTPVMLTLALVPLLILAGVLVWIFQTDAGLGERVAPPIETLSVQRVRLPEAGLIELDVINDGPDAITIAQVLVDEAYWQFTMEPAGALDRLESATISIPYPWVRDEGHAIGLLTATGVAFDAEIPVALASPEADGGSFIRLALVGLYVGFIPVGLGLLWYPFLRRLGGGAMRFILALTIGLLVFLVFDMWEAAHEVALAAPAALDPVILIPLLALLTAGLLMAIGNRSHGNDERPRGLRLAYNIATGIGLHNLGEGLAIGSAFAIGEVALGVFLVLGFTLHNVTEGIGIAAPLVQRRPALQHFFALAAVAGLPAVLGTWIGAFVYSPFWTVVFLAIGIGAIIQVVIEVGRMIWQGQRRANQPAVTWTTFGGVAAGMLVMYATALLVTG